MNRTSGDEEAANRDDVQKEGVEVEIDVEQEEPSVEASKEEDDRNETETDLEGCCNPKYQ